MNVQLFFNTAGSKEFMSVLFLPRRLLPLHFQATHKATWDFHQDKENVPMLSDFDSYLQIIPFQLGSGGAHL